MKLLLTQYLTWLIVSPLFGGCVAVQNNGNIIYPTNRYKAYNSVCGDLKASADSLGYSATTWNLFTSSVDLLKYNSIDPSKLTFVNKLLDGSSTAQWQPSWDCWVNHYEGYTWTELASANVQQYFITLGWNQDWWDNNSGTPSSESVDFDQLPSDQRSAATEVCFQKSTWNGDALSGGGSCGGGGGGGLICFSGANKVHVRDKGLVQIKSLQIGDYVMAGDGKFSRIYSFSHLDHRRPSEYLQIYMTGVPEPIEISAIHMLWVNNKMVRAGETKEGDVLLYKEEKVIVDKIRLVHRIGAYAPVTESGTILVGGVLCSSFVAILDHAPIDQHFATHAVLAPVRLLCSFAFNVCEQETYYDGYSTWIYAMMQIVEFVNSFSASVQIVASLAAMPFLLAVYLAVEMVLSIATFGVAAVGSVILCVHKKRWRKAVV